MISYSESLKILEEAARTYPNDENEDVDLLQSVERVLAEDLRARENNPPFDNSAMDGFAINAAAITAFMNSSNNCIPVLTLIAAGDSANNYVRNGVYQCADDGDDDSDFQIERLEGAVEIMTGAPIPHPYYDTVVRVEDVHVTINQYGQKMIQLNSKPRVGDNIRRTGEDTRAGDLLLGKGERISRKHLLVLATQGFSRVKVKKQIKVGILSTGKEIVDYATEKLRFGQIRNSTGIYLESSLANPLYKVKNYGIIPDNPTTYLEKLKELFDEEVELFISTGAVSMGVYDFVKPALESIGSKVHFHKCAIRPGKPILFSTLIYNGKTRYIFGLPGNPISTLVGFRFFIRPFIDFLLRGSLEKPLTAVLASDIKKPEGLKCFYKAKMFSDGPETKVEALKGQASFMVSPLLQSNAWMVLPEEGTTIKCGTQVEVVTL